MNLLIRARSVARCRFGEGAEILRGRTNYIVISCLFMVCTKDIVQSSTEIELVELNRSQGSRLEALRVIILIRNFDQLAGLGVPDNPSLVALVDGVAVV